MAQGDVGEVEVDALHEQVGGDDAAHLLRGSEDGTVITNALDGAGVLRRYVFSKAFDEAELTQFRYFHLSFTI